MTLEEYLLNELQVECPKLPRGKTLQDVVLLFTIGRSRAGWAEMTAHRFTNKFKEKTKQRKNHYIWYLEARNVKWCSKCDSVLPCTDFSSDKSNRTGLNSECRVCDAARSKDYRYLHTEECRARSNKHYADNKDQYLARNAQRRACKLNATPSWSETDLIKDFYANCPEGYHVDHEIPLQGELVCGLHVIANLQYLTAFDNLSKGNKFKAPLAEWHTRAL